MTNLQKPQGDTKMGQYCPLHGTDQERDSKGRRGAGDMRWLNPQMRSHRWQGQQQHKHRVSLKKLSGTLPLDDSKNWTVIIRSANNIRGREVESKDALTAAGSPRVVPRSSEYNAQGALSCGCSERTATGVGAVRERLVMVSWQLTSTLEWPG